MEKFQNLCDNKGNPDMDKIRENIDQIRNACDKKLNNIERRKLHADVELLRISFLDAQKKLLGENGDCFLPIFEELDKLVHMLDLPFVDRNGHWYDVIDEIIRCIGVWLCLVTFATTCALPLISLRFLDGVLVSLGILSPYYQITVLTRRFIASLILSLSGIVLSVEGRDRIHFAKMPTVCCFTHASTMDAFITAATIPSFHIALAKQDLFLIPFFSWLLTAFGGVPVNRHKRENAVTSLNIAVENLKPYDSLVIAPEGTRSKTGQLLPFKKGPFYLWEELQSPIVPIVIFGAFDLYPP
eukprot:gene13798-29341_t